jgi:hypothetical protein
MGSRPNKVTVVTCNFLLGSEPILGIKESLPNFHFPEVLYDSTRTASQDETQTNSRELNL